MNKSIASSDIKQYGAIPEELKRDLILDIKDP